MDAGRAFRLSETVSFKGRATGSWKNPYKIDIPTIDYVFFAGEGGAFSCVFVVVFCCCLLLLFFIVVVLGTHRAAALGEAKLSDLLAKCTQM